MGIYPLVIKKRNSPRLNQQKYGDCINWHKCQSSASSSACSTKTGDIDATTNTCRETADVQAMAFLVALRMQKTRPNTWKVSWSNTNQNSALTLKPGGVLCIPTSKIPLQWNHLKAGIWSLLRRISEYSGSPTKKNVLTPLNLIFSWWNSHDCWWNSHSEIANIKAPTTIPTIPTIPTILPPATRYQREEQLQRQRKARRAKSQCLQLKITKITSVNLDLTRFNQENMGIQWTFPQPKLGNATIINMGMLCDIWDAKISSWDS